MPETIEKKSSGQHGMLMTEGSILKNIFLFSIPLILGNLLQQTYNAVDSIIVGNCVGSNALAAVGAGALLIYLLIAFSQGASVGAGIIISQYLGARDSEHVRTAVHTAVTVVLILGALLTIGGLRFTRPLLIWMNTPEEVLEDAVLYLRIYSGGMVFNVLYNMMAGILNAAGNSRRSLLYLAAAAFTNIFMDVLLIAVLKMGVAGAAIATDMSQAASCILAFLFLLRVPADYQVHIPELRLNGFMALQILRVGLPTGIQNMVISLSNILVQAAVNGYGTAAMAGFGAYLKIDGFNILPVLSFSMAITTFVGQNYGAGNLKRVKKGMWVTLGMCIVYTVVTGALLLFFSRPALSLFTKDSTVIDFGQIAMRYFCPFYWLLAILHALAGTVRGTGKTVPPMVVLLLSLCLFRILWIRLILPGFHGIEGVYILYPFSWALGMVLMILYTWKGKWMSA